MQIVLIGYMGSGKSTIGKQLSKLLKISFLDLDNYMEEKLKMSVSEIFSKKGEIFFRKFETTCLEEIFKEKESFILATGGGTPCYGLNLEVMQQQTDLVIYLKASIGELVHRLKIEKAHRPLIKNIKELVQVESSPSPIILGDQMKNLTTIKDAYLAIEDDEIVAFGKMDDWGGITDWNGLNVIDATGKMVFPSWCDSHTHIVYAGTRENEFVHRIQGLSYEEIANNGGGILNSAKKLGATSEEELLNAALTRLNEIARQGTGAVEIKSGYGLSLEAEIKILRVIQQLKKERPAHKVLVSFFSPSGYEVKKNSIEADCITYLPLDTKKNVRKFLELVHPELALFVKYEFWPNYLNELKKEFDNSHYIPKI